MAGQLSRLQGSIVQRGTAWQGAQHPKVSDYDGWCTVFESHEAAFLHALATGCGYASGNELTVSHLLDVGVAQKLSRLWLPNQAVHNSCLIILCQRVHWSRHKPRAGPVEHVAGLHMGVVQCMLPPGVWCALCLFWPQAQTLSVTCLDAAVTQTFDCFLEGGRHWSCRFPCLLGFAVVGWVSLSLAMPAQIVFCYPSLRVTGRLSSPVKLGF